MAQIEHLPLSDLKAWPRNARSHSRKQVKQLAQSIKQFGFTQPVLVDENNHILAGHGRVRAAAQLDYAEVPCIRIKHLSQAQKRAYVLADNKLALNAEWNQKLLAEELNDLIAEDLTFDIGFSAAETERLIADCLAEKDFERKGGTTDAPARCATGDIWRLGSILLICGEALRPEAVNSLLETQPVQMLITRPRDAASTTKTSGAGEWTDATLLSAEKAGRRVVMSESDPLRCDRIIQSWEIRTKMSASRFNFDSGAELTRVPA